MPQSTNLSSDIIPKWVVDSIRAKLNNPGALDISRISMNKSHNPLSGRSQIYAYANTDKFDGAFVIFEDFNGTYREIYGTKVKEVLSSYSLGPDIVLSIMDESGTGSATIVFHLFKYTRNGYKDVWQGISSFYDFTDNNRKDTITGSINYSFSGELIHSILRRIYRGNDLTNPVKVEKYSDVYIYNNANMQYQFARRY